MAAWKARGFGFGMWLILCALSAACVDKRSHGLPLTDAGASVSSARSPAVNLSELEDACTSICERSRVLRCQRADDCLPNCLGAAAGTPCNAEFRAFYRCLVPQPIKNWECAEDGVAAIRPGFCEKEQERAVHCMEAKARP